MNDDHNAISHNRGERAWETITDLVTFDSGFCYIAKLYCGSDSLETALSRDGFLIASYYFSI